MFPFATSQSVPNILPIDASMTLGGMAPLNDTETKAETVPVPAIDTADFNEIETAFASLDTEADDVCKSDGSLPLEFRCRYRRGKCLQPRTLKKNGSMHSYCEYHRQLSVRNQRAFDQKKRCQRREDEAEKAEDDKTVSQRQISDSRVEDVEAPNLRAKQRSKRRRRAP